MGGDHYITYICLSGTEKKKLAKKDPVKKLANLGLESATTLAQPHSCHGTQDLNGWGSRDDRARIRL